MSVYYLHWVEEVSGRRISVEADCVETYLTTCEQDKIAPQLAIVRGLNEQEVNVRHRYLGDQDAHALLAALCVGLRCLSLYIDRTFVRL